MAIPGLLKSKRKPKNYKLKSFVAFLFLCIVFLVTFAYVFYQKQVLQVSKKNLGSEMTASKVGRW